VRWLQRLRFYETATPHIKQVRWEIPSVNRRRVGPKNGGCQRLSFEGSKTDPKFLAVRRDQPAYDEVEKIANDYLPSTSPGGSIGSDVDLYTKIYQHIETDRDDRKRCCRSVVARWRSEKRSGSGGSRVRTRSTKFCRRPRAFRRGRCRTSFKVKIVQVFLDSAVFEQVCSAISR